MAYYQLVYIGNNNKLYYNIIQVPINNKTALPIGTAGINIKYTKILNYMVNIPKLNF